MCILCLPLRCGVVVDGPDAINKAKICIKSICRYNVLLILKNATNNRN